MVPAGTKPPWANWEWHTGPMQATECCAECYQPLRSHAYGGVVKWRDRRLYAVGCLLDRLVAAPPAGFDG
jgi:hypothetical protein